MSVGVADECRAGVQAEAARYLEGDLGGLEDVAERDQPAVARLLLEGSSGQA